MKFCSTCGEEMRENEMLCGKCGAYKESGVKYCYNCGKPLRPGADICIACSTPVKNSIIKNSISEQKSKLVAVILAFLLGGLGIHDFYLGYTKNGVIKIVLFICTVGIVSSVWATVDFVRLLTDSLSTDAFGNELKKEF